MSAAALLDRLERVKRTGPGRWLARCPSHPDHSPSLSIRELDDERVLLHCFAGCSVSEVVAAVGIELSDLFPPREITHAPRERRRVFPEDVFHIIRRKALVVWLIGCDIHAEKTISERDYIQLGEALATLERVLDATYER